MAKIETWQLKQRLALSLEQKIKYSIDRIMEWYAYWDGKVYVAFSGGKDSTVLTYLVKSIYPDVPLVFCNTGLEFPEILKFVNTFKNNGLVTLRPKKKFREIINQYGYPIVSKENSQKIYEIRTTKSTKLLNKRLNGNDTPWKSGKLPLKWRYLINTPILISDKCCTVMKKNPAIAYTRQTERKPFIGNTVAESKGRLQQYLRTGCNSYNLRAPNSKPLAIWTEENIWKYINQFNVPYSDIYNKGYTRTGCIYCGFGCHLEKGLNRFQRLKQTHPRLWRHGMNKLGLREVMKVYGVPVEEKQMCLKLDNGSK